MTDAPERIYIDKVYGQHPEDWNFTDGKHLSKKQLSRKTAYTRADLAPDPALFAELVEALRRAKTELEMLRAKDTGAVYDVTLRLDLDAVLAKIGGGA